MIPNSNDKYFHLGATSGLITVLTAGDPAFAFRNASTKKVVCLTRLRVRVRTVVGFTAAQEHAWGAHKLTSYDANHSGGTSVGGDTLSRDLPAGVSELSGANIMIATTGTLTANSSPVVADRPFLWDGFAELAAAATVHKGRLDIDWHAAPDGRGLAFTTDEGFTLAPLITMGAGGTARLSVELDWFER